MKGVSFCRTQLRPGLCLYELKTLLIRSSRSLWWDAQTVPFCTIPLSSAS